LQNLLRRLVALALICLLFPALAVQHPPMPPIKDLTPAYCVHVVDGDTAWFEFEIDGVLTANKVRFLNIDTPETVHPNKPVQRFGPEASEYAARHLLERKVWLEFDKRTNDFYGRFLAFIWLDDGTLFNLSIVEHGYGKACIISPNRKYEELFMQAHEEARAKKIGLWQKSEE
jgi:micrococcal nuclease